MSYSGEVSIILLTGGTTGLPKAVPRTDNDFIAASGIPFQGVGDNQRGCAPDRGAGEPRAGHAQCSRECLPAFCQICDHGFHRRGRHLPHHRAGKGHRIPDSPRPGSENAVSRKSE